MVSESIFRITFFLLLICVFGIRGYYARRVHHLGERCSSIKKSIEQEGVMGIIFRIVVLILFAAIIVYAVNPPWMKLFILPFPFWSRWIGVLLGSLTFPLLIWVHRTLGKYWSKELELRKEHILITSGPYRWLRHPMYTFLSVFMIAISLVSANLPIVILNIIVIIILSIRTGREEQMMIERFGDEYRVYMERTGRLIPKFARQSIKSNTGNGSGAQCF